MNATLPDSHQAPPLRSMASDRSESLWEVAQGQEVPKATALRHVTSNASELGLAPALRSSAIDRTKFHGVVAMQCPLPKAIRRRLVPRDDCLAGGVAAERRLHLVGGDPVGVVGDQDAQARP